MSGLSLYPSRPRVRINCAGKVHVIPNQSYTLKEILQRFVRRESLPVVKEGTYADTGYDLEKVSNMDTVDRLDILEEVRSDVQRKRKKVEDLKKDVPPGPPPGAPGMPVPPADPPS